MQKIYIVLTHTGTMLSNIIKSYTKDEYSHVSIALDKDLKEMYSFGRIHPYIAFYGGFVKESLVSGTFKRFKKTQSSVFELEVANEQYEEIKKIISHMMAHKKEYKFNVLGLFLVVMNKKIKKPKTFYCAEFVRYVLQKSDIDITYLPEIIRPEDFKNLKFTKLIYRGKLIKYRSTMKRLEKVALREGKITPVFPKKAAV